MPSDSTLTATIAYEGSKRAQISDLTVELIPLTVALNGTPITSYTVTVTDYWGQPSTFAVPDAAGSARGVLVGPGTAHELGTGTWRVWVHYDGDPEDITRRADGWIEVAGASLEVSAALSVVSQYQLRAERGQPGGYATLGVDGIVDPGQLPVAAGGSDPLKQDVSEKGQVGGYAALDGAGTVPTAQLPASLATDAEVTAAVAGKANTSHTHVEADVTGLVTDLAGKEATVTAGTTGQYYRGDKTFVTLDKTAAGLPNVDNTADTAKPVSTAQQTALNLKAPLASPALTGTPTAPTPTAADNSTKLATTAYADGAATTAASGKANTSHTHAEADVMNLAADLGLKAPLASPALTGTPTAPTAAPGTNTTQIASTAFVIANAGSTPDADATTKGKVQLAGDLGGTAASPTVPGLSAKAPLASPTFTGTPAAPTPSASDNSTKLATTAYVDTADALRPRKDVQTFTATGAGTWNCPAWAVATSITQTELIAGGGGGGSGRRNAAGNARGGGSGGAGAAHSVVTHKTLTLAAAGGTLAVNVGAGGAGGAGVAASTVSDGNAGTAGGASWVGTASYAALVYAGGGAGGVAGSTGAGATAVAGSGSFVGGSGAAGSATAAGVTSNTSANAATGGGGGGAVDSSNVAYAGGSAGAVIGINPTLSSGGVVGGAAPTTNTSATVGDPQVGTGGGGGAGSTTACGQAGADGGRYGGAGGGAGGGLNSASAGFAGGAGANGIIVMTTWE